MAQIFLALIAIAGLVLITKIAILLLLLAGLIFRTKETIGLLLIAAVLGGFVAHPLIGVGLAAVLVSISLYFKRRERLRNASDEQQPTLPGLED